MPLRAEIVSPQKRHLDQEVDMAVVPGSEGDIAAMPGRAPVMLQLRGGVVTLYLNGKVLQRSFVNGGFVDMTANHCTILADSVRALEDLSVDDARESLAELEAQWTSLGTHEDKKREKLAREMQAVRAEIEAAEQFQQNAF
ncbi:MULTISPECIES: ATP synthase F1 subunit epsilon [unclassified Saccharibacter]|uniref:ATP synthase F1 subunit epsilon n=1 Tax=unclassified Saccharibacter TaxID=2648722 RepID=UPI0013241CD6|nr:MULTISPECIES: ATP synthase F1 subunit epsilon [unclassified Saccharibacter]MXV36712.1 ATP synthase F1 subunit epsilon [Saccharibacter sp. EH611]MXV58204.1 ATP synthase F1 subunit epsilon [Saccharibacter sp. EH70]MXV65660.1 ATP synthase F1 subunit epsilon [Saccharibacter sp. EH60]